MFNFFKKMKIKKEMIDDIKVVRKKNRLKTISLKIKDGEPEISCPVFTSRNQIRSIIEKRQEWIRRKIAEQQRQKKKSFKFDDRKKINFLNKKLTIIFKNGSKNNANLIDENLIITSSNQSLKNLKDLLIRWYKFQAKKYLKKRTKQISLKIGINFKLVCVKGYKGRWGACSSSGEIFLNWKLMMLPRNIIDYIIVHELCHIVEPNHSSRFWLLVEKFEPEYNRKKDWLKTYGSSIISFS